MAQKRPRVALVWAQFAAYHVDRCEAVAQRLNGKADVIAIEVASASKAYFWEPSEALENCRKITLFPDAGYEGIGEWRRFAALLRATWRCSHVFVGIGYNERAIIALSWLLRLLGVSVIAMSDSKFEDRNRSALFELAKSLLLLPYRAAIVASGRSIAYFRFLGFRKRQVMPGYDTVRIERIQSAIAQASAAGPVPFAERKIVFVGRFIDEKNLPTLIAAYAIYVSRCGSSARRLVLAGTGANEQAIRELVSSHGIGDRVEFPGYLASDEVSRLYARALVLVLVSASETWGLVVNEALAAGVPSLVSTVAGARDLLVRNLVNGAVVEHGCADSIARALAMISRDEESWHAMCRASADRAWMGDVIVFADAAEALVIRASPEASRRLAIIADELAAANARDMSARVDETCANSGRLA